MFEIKENYDVVFEIEMDGWAYGIANYPGEIYPGLVHTIIREIAVGFQKAIDCNYAFDLPALAKKFAKAAKFLIHEKEVAFSILANLPHPMTLDPDRQFIMAQIVDKADQEYGGVVERLNHKWAVERREMEEERACQQAPAASAIPPKRMARQPDPNTTANAA